MRLFRSVPVALVAVVGFAILLVPISFRSVRSVFVPVAVVAFALVAVL